MKKSILVFKLHEPPTDLIMDSISREIGKDYFIIYLTCGNGENESVKILTKGRDSATLTKKLERLINGKGI